MPFEVTEKSGPYTAQVSVGLGLQFSWDLYAYVQVDQKWTRTKLGNGTGNTECSITSLQDGTVLTWSILTVNNDEAEQPVKVTAQLVNAKNQPQSMEFTAKVSRKAPAFFINVTVKKGAGP